MEPMNLSQFYNDLKSSLVKPEESKPLLAVGSNPMSKFSAPGAVIFRNKCLDNADRLKDTCRKHILLDIYCKILPADDDWKAKHFGLLKGDINNMLDNKGVTATQYLTSAYESTNAPLLEFIIRSTENIGKQYLKEADETLNDAQANNIKLPEPKEPDPESDEVNSQLVDISKDNEYKNFVNTLKQKTIDKIVSDISNIINEEKEKNDMTFDTSDTPGMPNVPEPNQNESVIAVCMDYVSKKLLKEHKELDENKRDMIIEMATREATLRELDNVFNISSTFREFTSKINFGKGILINESVIANI